MGKVVNVGSDVRAGVSVALTGVLVDDGIGEAGATEFVEFDSEFSAHPLTNIEHVNKIKISRFIFCPLNRVPYNTALTIEETKSLWTSYLDSHNPQL